MKRKPNDVEETARLAQQLLDAVAEAPLETIRQVANPAFDADASAAAFKAVRHINSLRKIAGAGNEKAILFLVELGNIITTTLANLVSAAHAKEAGDPPTSAAEDTHEDQALEKANSEFVSAMEEWVKHAEIQNLANADPHFWVGISPEDKKQQDCPVSHTLSRDEFDLVPEVMKSLREDFGQILYLDAVHHIQEITKTSWYWPVSVRPSDLHTNRSLKEILPALHLLPSFGRGFSAPSKGSGTPSHVAKSFYIKLELQRTFPRPERRLEAWRQQEKADVDFDSFDKLFLAKSVSPSGSQTLSLHQVMGHDLCDEPIWDISNIWIRKAALLEPLSESNIKQWVDAACYCIGAQFRGSDTEMYEAYPKIESRVVSNDSLQTGLKKFFTDGFGALAKCAY